MEQMNNGAEAKQDQKIFGMSATDVSMLVRMFLENKDQVKALVEAFTPAISESIDVAMDAVGPQVSKIALRISIGKAENRAAVVAKYNELGFSRKEAVDFMLADIGAINRATEAMAKATKSASTTQK